MAVTPRKLFVAGSTGAIGRLVVQQADAAGIPIVPHARPRRSGAADADPRAVLCDLADRPALTRALTGCTTVLQLVGTMRKRFARGDSYETSDIATTQQLVDAGKDAGIDHVVLLSSAGAGSGTGPYLAAKARAEAIVTSSGIAHTIVRPGFFRGAGHSPPPLSGLAASLLHVWSWRPIDVEDVGRVLLRVARERAPCGVVEGRTLWDLVPRR